MEASDATAIDWATIITVAISALALVFSAIATVHTVLSNRRQNKVNRSQEEINLRLLEKDDKERIDSQQADLDVNFVKVSKSHKLKIYNRGKSPARNVIIKVDEGDAIFMKDEIEEKFPLDELRPHDGVELHAIVTMGTGSKHVITLRWDDAFGKNRTATRTCYLR